MSSIVLSGDTSGSVTVSVPAVAGTNTVTIPATTGTVMVSSNMPAFSAYNSTTQTLAYNTVTKITFNTETFDTNNNFASSRFTPTVAGYYQINVKLYFVGTALRNYYFLNLLYKNGAVIAIASVSIYQLGSGVEFSAFQSELVYMNGTTDYLEVYGYQVDYTSSASISVVGGSGYSSFNGSLVRAA
jgi:hypothetical protein